MEKTPIIEMFGNCYDSPVFYAIPLADIPIEDENDADRVHDGVNPCDDPECPCQQFGYEVQ